jgi:hypothetical protein
VIVVVVVVVQRAAFVQEIPAKELNDRNNIPAAVSRNRLENDFIKIKELKINAYFVKGCSAFP